MNQHKGANLIFITFVLNFFTAHRHIGETNMNLYSSRSHTIFRMVELLFLSILLSFVNFHMLHYLKFI